MDKIVERIRKLLALAESANEHEATLAMEKASALLNEHNLDMAQIHNDKGTPEDPIGHTTATTKAASPWVRKVWNNTARLYFCTYFYQTGGSHRTDHTVIGTSANTTTACMMATYLCDTIIRLARESMWENDPGNTRYDTAFRKGCADRLSARMYERFLDMQDTKNPRNPDNLPMVVTNQLARADHYMREQFKTTSKTARRTAIGDYAGYAAGRVAGNSISFDQQVEANKRKAIR